MAGVVRVDGALIVSSAKPGVCPFLQPNASAVHACQNDYGCQDDLKCCSHGLGFQCIAPLKPQPGQGRRAGAGQLVVVVVAVTALLCLLLFLLRLLLFPFLLLIVIVLLLLYSCILLKV